MAEFGAGFRVTADTTSFEKGMAAAATSAEGVGKKIAGAFGAKNIGATLATALGLNLTSLAEKLVAPFREAAESAARIAGFTERAATAQEKMLSLRQSENQQMATLERSLARLQERQRDLLDQKPSESFFAGIIAKGSAIDALLGLSRREELKRQDELAEVTAKTAEAQLELETKRAAKKKKDDGEELKSIGEIAKSKKEQADSAKELREFEKEAARAKLPDAEKIISLKKDETELARQIAGFEKFVKEGGELTNDGNKELLALKEAQVKVQEKINEAVKATGKAEAVVTDEVKTQVVKKEEFFAITSKGRGDSDLSDRELARKIDTTRKDINQRQIASPFQPDFFLSPQKFNLNQALAEQSLRQRIRSQAASFGEDRAFAMNPGVSERRFQEIISGMQNDSKRQTAALEDINRRMKSGLPVVNLNTGG